MPPTPAQRWCWFGFVDVPPVGALASADAYTAEDGEPAGLLAAWPAAQRRQPGASRLDLRVVDADGPPMAVSLAVAPAGLRVLFDDPAVVAATRAVLARPSPAFVSTLVRDAAHIAGAVTGIEADVARRWPAWFDDDPFARIFPARRLRVGPGLFGRVAAPVGPVHQRYGGLPWPVAGFPGPSPT